MPIETLKEKAYSLVGRPEDLQWEDQVVAVLEARDGAAVSASAVRQAIHDGQPERIRDWVPASTYDFFTGPRGASVCAAIQREAEVIHY